MVQIDSKRSIFEGLFVDEMVENLQRVLKSVLSLEIDDVDNPLSA
jgi:hypothetical protein